MKNENETTNEVKGEHIESQVQESAFETWHEWRQFGNYLRCQSCPFAHGTHIGTDVFLTGIDEQGKPILKKVEISQ